MSELTHVKGLAELQKFLDELPVKIEKNIMRGALRAGMKVVEAEAKSLVPIESGLLRDSIKIKAGRVRDGKVTVSVIAGGKTNKSVSEEGKVTYHNPYYARWVEYGTSRHYIKAVTAKALILRRNSRASSGFAKRWTSWVIEGVDHPGAKPKPFMRPALDNKAQDAVIAAGNYIKNRLATKEGLDTSDIEIGAGE